MSSTRPNTKLVAFTLVFMYLYSVNALLQDTNTVSKAIMDMNLTLQNTVLDLKHTISEMNLTHQQTVSDLRNTNAALQQSISQMKATNQHEVSDLRNTNAALQQSISQMKATNQHEVAELHHNITMLEHSISEMNQTLQENANKERRNRCIFYAKLSSSTHFGPSQIIDFDNVLLNVGGAYDSRLGHFTAPTNGYYHFTVTVMSISAQEFYVLILKNGNAIGNLYTNDDYTSVTTNVNIELLKNDLVWIMHQNFGSSDIAINGAYASFSGYLISEI